MRFLVTGATGFVGNNVVRQLLAKNHQVRALTRDSSAQLPLERLDVESCNGCVTDLKAVRNAMVGIDAVIHAAANLHIGWKNLESIRQVNVTGTHNIALAAREAGAKMVHVSSVDALAAGTIDQPIDETSPNESKLDCTYIVTKREAERAVQEQAELGLNAVIANPGFMLGPWDWKPSSGRMLLTIAKTFTPVAPSGGMSVCDIRDVSRALIEIAERRTPKKRYILAGHNVTYFDAWKCMAELTGGRAPFNSMGPVVRKMTGWIGDLAARITGKEGDLNSAMLCLSAKFHYYCSDRAKQELAYQVRPLDETITDAWNWFREYDYA